MPTVSVPFALGLTGRRRLDHIVDGMIRERSSYEKRWKTLAEYVLPMRPRFTMSDVNRGNVDQVKILDSTATQAVDIARSGLLNGMASPSRPWFILDTASRGVEKTSEVLRWLDSFRDRILDVLERSNFYSSLGQLFGDELVFGTGAMGMFADDESFVRCHVFPIGSYAIAQDAAGRINQFARDITMTVVQVVEKFGVERVSHAVRMSYFHERYQDTVEVRHLIAPNMAGRPGSPYPSDLPYYECYWEKGQDGEGGDALLSKSGYHEFPIIAARWERGDEDTWATRWPCAVALGDIKMLQGMERKVMNGLSKMVDPALVGGPSLKNRPVSLLSGEVTLEDASQAGQGLRPIHDVRLPIDQVEVKMEQVRDRIRHALYTPYFLMLLSDARGTPPTAEEVRQRMREKLQVLGPVMERHSDDVFGPVIERVSAMMMRVAQPAWAFGIPTMLEPPPQSLEDVELRVEYVSEVAQAQKLTGLAGLERHVGFAVAQAQIVGQDILDNIDFDAAMAEHASMVGVSPKVRRSEGERSEMRIARAEAAQEQQAIANAPPLARAARDLSEVPQADDILDRAAPVGALEA